MRQNDLQKYFSKRRQSVVELIFIVLLIACIPVAIFLPGGIPLSIPIASVSAVALVFMQAVKVKDSEVDQLLQGMIGHIPMDPRYTLKTYDLSVAPAVKGKDGKLRTSRYVVSVFEPMRSGDETRRITVYRVDLLAGDVVRKVHDIPINEALTLSETHVMTAIGRRSRYTLTSPALSEEIPVPMDDIDSAKLVEELCGEK